jgi:uncharacterized protein YggE
MKIPARLLAAIGSVLLSHAPVMAQAPVTEHQGPAVVTVGEGMVDATPDRAVVTIAVEARARGPKEAQSQAAAIMTAVQKSLADAKLPSDAIRTTGFDLQQEFDYHEGRQTPRGFVARNSVEVRLDDIAQVGSVLDRAVTAGATGVSGIQFDVKDRAALEREAVKRAVGDARARAEAAAAGAGATIDRILRIEEARGGGVMPPMPMYRTTAMAAEAAAQTPVAPGRIEIRARVTLTAALR